jgi:xylulokinase
VTLVAGVDSSTQSCKVVIRDAATGELVRKGSAPHPDATEVDPEIWWEAARAAVAAAGGLDDVAAMSVAAQQHGMVCLDETGRVVRPALLWNDMRSGPAAEALVAELGPEAWAKAVGSVPVASFTVTKMRWLAEHEPDNALRTAAVCLPHDWLTWRFLSSRGARAPGIESLTTDRSDASGTGYWSAVTNDYRLDLLELALGRVVGVPRVLGPAESPGRHGPVVFGPGAGDNASAALFLGSTAGEVIVSVGTSGVATASSDVLIPDSSGTVAGFADATGRYLPLVCTVNASRVLDAFARILGVDQQGLSDLALSAPAGADGLVLLPYLEGERTPNLPAATGELRGLRHKTSTPAHLARAAVEGVLCGLADGLDALESRGVVVEHVHLIGGGSRSEALRRIAPTIFGRPVLVPPPGEYVADGAAFQAMWALDPARQPAPWPSHSSLRFDGEAVPGVRARYGEVRDEVVAAARPDKSPSRVD